MGRVYTFIEPERPSGPSTRDQLVASLAISPAADNLELARIVSDAECAISDGCGALIDAETHEHEARALRGIKLAASLLLAEIAAYERGAA